jgi:hypothetical protein
LESPYPHYLNSCSPEGWYSGPDCKEWADGLCNAHAYPWWGFVPSVGFWWESDPQHGDGTIGGGYICTWNDEINGCTF